MFCLNVQSKVQTPFRIVSESSTSALLQLLASDPRLLDPSGAFCFPPTSRRPLLFQNETDTAWWVPTDQIDIAIISVGGSIVLHRRSIDPFNAIVYAAPNTSSVARRLTPRARGHGRERGRQFPPKECRVPGTARPPVSSAHGTRVLTPELPAQVVQVSPSGCQRPEVR